MTAPITNLTETSTTGTTSKSRNRLDQEQFFKLMITQLKNQDPMKPLESAEFFGQLAQFSTVAGIADLQTSFGQFAASMQSNRAMQAATLIGRTVLAPSEHGALAPGQTLSGTIALPADTGELRVRVFDGNGQLVRQLDLGAQASGTLAFAWDGVRDDGTTAAPGRYRLRAEAVLDGRATALDTAVWTPVDSVTLGAAGAEPLLNLTGLGSLPLSKIGEIR